MSLNKVMLIGHLGADPDIREMGSSGRRVANLRVATSESWKDKATGERKEKTEWHTVSVFVDGLINTIERFCKKGMKVYVEGQLVTRKYEKDGQDRFATEIHLQGFNSQFQMLDGVGGEGGEGRGAGAGGGQRSGGSNAQAGNQQRRDPAPAFDDDDIPF